MANTVAETDGVAAINTGIRTPSIWSALPSFRETVPGASALIIIALFCGLPGVPWPITVENFLHYIDQVLPPYQGKGIFIDLLHFNYVVIGLTVGIVIRNVIGVPKSWEPGLGFTGVLMNAGIIMIGSQYMLRDLIIIGGESIMLMVAFVFGTATLVIVFCKLFKVENTLAGLLAAGFSMCGVSACVAIAPMVKAKSDQVAYAIASLITFGIACLFILPFFGRLLDIPQHYFGIASAVGVPNSAQVIATGFNFGFEAGKVAGFANIGRIVLIPAGVLYIYFLTFTQEFRRNDISVWQVIKDKFPMFVIGFIVIWTMSCLHLFPKPAVFAMEKIMSWLFTLCFVSIGLQTKLSDVADAGWKGVSVAWLAGIIKVTLVLITVWFLLKIGLFGI